MPHVSISGVRRIAPIASRLARAQNRNQTVSECASLRKFTVEDEEVTMWRPFAVVCGTAHLWTRAADGGVPPGAAPRRRRQRRSPTTPAPLPRACCFPNNSRAASEGIPMEFNGMPWNSMESYGIQWNPMEFNGILWNSMGFNGILWNSMEFNGILWNPMESNGIQWKPMEAHGVQWSPMECNGIL
eukprot:gene14458-biopygen12169